MRLARVAVLCAALVAGVTQAWGQATVLQAGPSTPGHSVMMVGQGYSQPIVQDAGGAAGGAAGSNPTEQGLMQVSPTGTYPNASGGAGPNGTNWCDYDAPTTNPTGYHYLCIGPNANGYALIASGSGGGATALPLRMLVNGVLYDPTQILPTFVANAFLTTSASGPQWTPLSTGPMPILVTMSPYNAACNGTTNDAVAIQAALTAAATTGGHVELPNARCYTASAITVPDNVTFSGVNYAPGTGGTQGSVLLCLSTLAGPCLIVGNGDNKPNNVETMTIARASGTVSATGECMNIPGGQQVHVSSVECYNHAQGFEVDPPSIYVYFKDIETCKITDAHFIDNASPAVYVNHSQMGCNGNYDAIGNDFIRAVGNWDAVFGTIHFTDVQLNLGQNAVACALHFKSLTGSTNIVSDVEFIGGHIETAQNFVCTDSTVLGLQYFQVVGTWVVGGWGGSNALFQMNAATKVYAWALGADTFTGWTTATLAPTTGIDDLKITGSNFSNTALSITGNTPAQINLEGNTYQGVTLAGAFELSSKVTGTARAGGGSYTYSFTGPLELDIPGYSWAPCTLNLAFGGASTGITYASQSCQWNLRGSQVTVAFIDSLSSNGSATGAATLTGLPLSAGSGIGQTPLYARNMASLCITTPSVSCGAYASEAPGATTVNLYTMGATGVGVLADTNFSSSSYIAGTLTYPLTN